jgi:hypothetical protein
MDQDRKGNQVRLLENRMLDLLIILVQILIMTRSADMTGGKSRQFAILKIDAYSTFRSLNRRLRSL